MARHEAVNLSRALSSISKVITCFLQNRTSIQKSVKQLVLRFVASDVSHFLFAMWSHPQPRLFGVKKNMWTNILSPKALRSLLVTSALSLLRTAVLFAITPPLSSFYTFLVIPSLPAIPPLLSACVSHCPTKNQQDEVSLPESILIGFHVHGIHIFCGSHGCPAGPLLALALAPGFAARRMPKQDPLGGYSGRRFRASTSRRAYLLRHVALRLE